METKHAYFINPATILGSSYAQIVSVTVASDGMTTLDFVYKHPRDPNEGQVVSRVTIPTPIAKELAALLKKTIEQSKLKEKETKNGKSK